MLTFEERATELSEKPSDQNSAFRKEALRKAFAMGRPTRKTENLRYLNVSPYFELPLSNASGKITATESATIVFEDGIFSAERSHLEGLKEVMTFSKAMDTYGMALQNRMQKSMQEESAYFALLNTALYDEGLFVYLPPNFALEKPISIVHRVSGKRSHVHTKIHVFAAKNAEATFTQSIEGQCTSFNSYIDFSVEENAKISCYDVFANLEESWVFSHVRATVKRDANFRHYGASNGAKAYRSDIKCTLQDENAFVDLKGLWTLAGENNAHTLVRVEHRAPNTRSSQHYRGTLRGHARASFEGQIYVTDNALLTDAYQLSEQMILDETASAFSKPNLEIFADDVKASHGATITQLSEEELFYLQTRGISPSVSKEMLVKGFMSFFLNDIPCEKTRDQVRSLL